MACLLCDKNLLTRSLSMLVSRLNGFCSSFTSSSVSGVDDALSKAEKWLYKNLVLL